MPTAAPALDPAIGRGAVVVTGASSGIGGACALRLDRAGFTVLAGVRRDQDGESLRAVASERLRPILLDVTDSTSIERAVATLAETAGARGLAGLVNNAGVVVPGVLEHLDLDTLRHQLEVNVIGQVAVTKACLPALRAARGRVVNVGSIGGLVAMPFLGPYHASKFALEALTDSLRQELHPFGIEVSIIEPGTIATRIWGKGDTAAESIVSGLPAHGRSSYGHAIRAFRAISGRFAARGLPPDRVARVVEHALTARRPRTRYLVGVDARAQALLRKVLPDRAFDALVRWQAGLPGRR